MPSAAAQYNIYFVAGNMPVSQSSATVATPKQPAIMVSPTVRAQRSEPVRPNPGPTRAPARPTSCQAPRSIRDVRSRSPARSCISSRSGRRSLSPPPGCWDASGVWQAPQYGHHDVRVPPVSAASGPPPQGVFNVFTPTHPGLRLVPNRNFVSVAHTNEQVVSTGVTENQANIRSWLRHREDSQFPISATFVKYFAQQLDRAGVQVHQLLDLRLSVFDPQQHLHIDDETLKPYYVLTAQLSDRQIPPQTRAAPALNIEEVVHLQFVHASSMGGIVGILQDGFVGPSRLHFDFSQSFFCLAAKRSSDIKWDRAEQSRLIHNAWLSAKNSSNILVLGTAWGTGEVVYSGGEETCLRKTLHHGAVHHKNGRMWVVNSKSHCIQSLAFSTDAENPAGTL